MKVGHKTRHGRKASPVPHKSHRTPRGAISDPITRAFKRQRLRWMERDRQRMEAGAW